MNDVVSAERVTAYGDKAVAQGTRVAQVPKKSGGTGPAAAPPTLPAHVAAARKVWDQHFAKTWKKVVIHDISRAPSKLIQTSSFDAWTNSGTQIFVGTSANKSPAYLYVVMHHEAEHIRQFRKDGKHPPNYTLMMDYEYEAYTASANETKRSGRQDVRALNPDAVARQEMFGDKMDDAEATIQDPALRDAEYKRWLEAGGMLPAHSSLASLYK